MIKTRNFFKNVYRIAGKFEDSNFRGFRGFFVNLKNFILENFWLLDKFINYGSSRNILIYLRESNVADWLYQ